MATTSIMKSLFASITLFLLIFTIASFIDHADATADDFFLCEGNHNIDTTENSPSNSFDCGSFPLGPVRLVWKVTGNKGFVWNDEVSFVYEIERDNYHTTDV